MTMDDFKRALMSAIGRGAWWVESRSRLSGPVARMYRRAARRRMHRDPEQHLPPDEPRCASRTCEVRGTCLRWLCQSLLGREQHGVYPGGAECEGRIESREGGKEG